MALHVNNYTHEHLLDVVEKLQHFWSLPNSSPPIAGKAMVGIYRALAAALKVYEADKEQINYIKLKMHDSAPKDASLEEQIEHGIKEVAATEEVPRSSVDNRLRCLFMLMRHGKLKPYNADRTLVGKAIEKLKGEPTPYQQKQYEEHLLEPVGRNLEEIVIIYNRTHG
jgi:hypothetical protein